MKRILSVVLVAVLVLGFSDFALGAGKNSEQDYIGAWGYKPSDGENTIWIYPSHSGEWRVGKNYFGFTWTDDNGYLVIHTYETLGEELFTFQLNADGDALKNMTNQPFSLSSNFPTLLPKMS